MPKANIVLLAALTIACGCRSPQRASQPTPPHQTGTATAATPDARPIRAVLAMWRSGRRHAALEAVAAMAQRDDWHTALCLMPMTEEQFIRLPQDEQTSLQQRLVEDLDIVRALARGLRAEARQAEAAGDHEAAQQWRLALRRLGRANRGQHVPALVDLVGQAILRLDQSHTQSRSAANRHATETTSP